MNQTLLINAMHPEEFRVALVENQLLEGFFLETASRGKMVGNIYKGIIAKVQPSLQAAFVNYGMEKHGFLPLSEIHPEYFQREVEEKAVEKQRIQDLVKPGQEVLVQVTKEEIGNKGAALTSYVSLAGRFLVLMPGQAQYGVSRKIEDESQRKSLKELIQELKIPPDFGLIVRTAAENLTKREINKDLNYLLRIWEDIRKRVEETPAPNLIYKERDLAIRVIRDYFNPSIKTILVDDKEVHRQVKEFLQVIYPGHKHIVKLHKDKGPIFHKYNLENQIEQLFHKKVTLKSGGYLVIDSTEALVAIDVNSGRATREQAQEEMVYKVNLEAAAEIPRQLRLRDLGGLVVIDFIDMREGRHIREVERHLREELKKDKAKTTVGRISRFGLLELSRQHLGLNVRLGSYADCPHCLGTGMVRSTEASAIYFLRKIWLMLAKKDVAVVKGTFPLGVANYLVNQKRQDLIHLEETYQTSIQIEASASVMPHEANLEFITREPTAPAQAANTGPAKKAPASATPPSQSPPEELPATGESRD
jgi:ribonuclease E